MLPGGAVFSRGDRKFTCLCVEDLRVKVLPRHRHAADTHSPLPAIPPHKPAFAGPTVLECPPAALSLLTSPAPGPAASSTHQLISFKHNHPSASQSLVPHVCLHHPPPSVSTSPSASVPWSSTLHCTLTSCDDILPSSSPPHQQHPHHQNADNSNTSCNAYNHHPLPYPTSTAKGQ